jgi:oxygen-independent coproporphyrinogen-3 oxidase
MVNVLTNTPAFQNDIAEEIRLFLDMADIRFVGERVPTEENDCFLQIELSEEDGMWISRALCSYNNGSGIIGSEACFKTPVRSESRIVRARYMKRCVKIAVFRAIKKLFPVSTPWGSLTGIRPTRLLRDLLTECSPGEAERIMLFDFDVSREKYALAEKIIAVQKPFVSELNAKDLDVYIGIPFCVTRCLYCSFASEVRSKKANVEGYLNALKDDITTGAGIVRDKGFHVRSVYIGGGTPTSLNNSELDSLLAHTLRSYGGFGREFTVEAGRPDTIDKDKLAILKDHGVTRVSVNPQSMNEKTLVRIGRSHSAGDIETAFRMARDEGFDVINMDIIAGLPGEDPDDFQYTLDRISEFAPENLTVHTLAIKRSSVLKQRLQEFPLPGPDEAEAMVRNASEAASRLGMQPYYMYRQKYMRGNLENVGYSVPGAECMYNIDMMEETTSIMAHGAGAMSKRVFEREQRVERIPAPKDIGTYIKKTGELGKLKAKLFSDPETPLAGH